MVSMVNAYEVYIKLLYLVLLFSTTVLETLNFYTVYVWMARKEEGLHSVDQLALGKPFSHSRKVHSGNKKPTPEENDGRI